MIDGFDKELLLELYKNGRQSYVDIAETMHVTETTVRNRVKRLIKDGIMNITVAPDLDMLGYGFVAIVGLQVHLADLRKVAEQLVKHPNVCYVANVTGRFEFIIIVAARSAREYAEFMERNISVIPGIDRTETFVNLNIYKGKSVGLDTEHLIQSLVVESAK